MFICNKKDGIVLNLSGSIKTFAKGDNIPNKVLNQTRTERYLSNGWIKEEKKKEVKKDEKAIN
jgi:hypothetical protein